MLAYDDVWSIEYLNRRLRPLWRQRGRDIAGLLEEGAKNYSWFAKRARAFDEELTSDLVKSGGPEYAALATVAYRQAIAAHKLVADVDGTPLLFPKENFSNGCISTVDVIYPSAPLFLLLNPELLKGMLRPVLDYAALPRWRWPFAPHDLGQYPLANGQVYGGGERTEEDQMPVEESGNMLILLGALAHVEGNADFALRYWPQLVRWAEYLRDKGMDPENQLSTDDFAGHLAHNTNLSIKAILGLRAFAEIARMGGFPDAAYFVELKPGYALGGGTSGPMVVPVPNTGQHGYLPDRPEMRSSLFLLGRGLPAGKDLGIVDMRQIAPTLAAILGVKLPSAAIGPVDFSVR